MDVSIERDGKLIACEISETTSDAHEIKNIQKCLAESGLRKGDPLLAGAKVLGKGQAAAEKGLKKAEAGRVFFLQPEELYFILEEEAAGMAGKEERVKGYRVKISFSPVREGEKKSKREAVAKVTLGAMRRARGQESRSD